MSVWFRRLLAIAWFVWALPFGWAESTTARAMQLARDAAKAAEEKDTATYLTKMEEAVALRPDYPRMLVNLAAAQVANDRPDDAVTTLGRLAALGLSSPVEKSRDFAGLRERKDFQAVVKKLGDNALPEGRGKIGFLLREVTGLIEGIAWRAATGEFYFGDVNGRAVWVRGPKEEKDDAPPRRLTPEGDGLYGVFGLAIDEPHHALWAATSAVPGMRGFTADQDGTAALAEIDLDSGAIRRVIPVVRKEGDRQSHVLGDLTLLGDGSVLLTDSGAPLIWRLAPDGSALEPIVESDEILSGQGIVAAPDGAALFMSDYPTGLLRIDLQSHSVRRLEAPADSSLVGIDGLILAPNGDLIGIQNGVRPNRVIRIVFDPSGESVSEVKVLESGHLQMAAPSLGCLGPSGDLYFIGNAGWTRFENTGGQPTDPRPVPIYCTPLMSDAEKKAKKHS